MTKTNAERQREYRERKKAKDGLKYLENERKRQKRNYTEAKYLSKKQLKERREAVKLRVQKHRKSTKKQLESACNIPLTTSSIASPVSDSKPFLVAMNFSKRGQSSRKRKRRSDDRFYKKIARQENEKKANINEHVTAVYDRDVYVSTVIDIDDSDVHSTFHQHNGGITQTTVFHVPNRKDEVWVAHEDILYILPEPSDTKSGKTLDQAVVTVIEQ